MLLHPRVLIYSRIDGIRLSPKAPGPIPAAWPRAVTSPKAKGFTAREARGRLARSVRGPRHVQVEFIGWRLCLLAVLFRVGFRKKMECLGSINRVFI